MQRAPAARTSVLLKERRGAVLDAVKRCRGRRVWLFGSVARGEDGPDSDIDFLADFEPDSSLFDVLHLTQELGELLGRSVDVVSTGGLKDRDRLIRDEAVDF